MDTAFQLKRENPFETANVLSKLFYTWMIGLFYKGTKKGLEVSDLFKTLACNKSDMLGDNLAKNWEIEIQRAKYKDKKPSLLRAILKTFFWSYSVYGLLLFFQFVCLRSPQPVVLAWLISQFSPGQIRDATAMYTSAGLLITISTLVVFLMHHTNYGQCSIGMRVRIACSSLVYRKIMRLNKKSLGKTAAGQVINLLSNDVNRFDLVCMALHYLWIMPFQVALVTYFLWQQVGISCLAGVLSMALLSLPVQGYLGKLTSSLRLRVAQRTDSRVKLMGEIISGIQVIKMYAWEKPFEKMINFLRVKEINVLTKTSYLRGIYLSCMVFIERSTLFLTILCYVLLGNDIRASQVFSLAQFFNILQACMAIFYPMAISYGAEAYVSVKRLEEFLILEEVGESCVEKTDDKGITLKNVEASWVPELPAVLKDINIHIPPGTLCAVVGPVGAGKSSLLQLLLGELPPTSGKVQVGGEISYSSQEPWLFAATVRKNILFGKDYNRIHYQNVVKVCALEKDFEQFPQGDKTVVGERGVSLSGGQRARINLARAVYRQANIYLLDDPLSAVDTHVGKHLFEKCVGEYLHDKTRILVTHQLQYLKKADVIVVLNEGKVEAQGTFEELSKSELDFTKMLAGADETTEEKEKDPLETTHSTSAYMRKSSVFSLAESILEGTLVANPDNEEETGAASGISPFREYFKAAGNCCTITTLVVILILGQAACTGADYWVALWTSQEELRATNRTEILSKALPLERIEVYNSDWNSSDWNNSNIPPSYYTYTRELTPERSQIINFDDVFDTIESNGITYTIFKTNVAIYIYTGLIVAAITITLMRSFLFFTVAMTASKNLHSRMFHCLLKAPMRFFDTNPSGRVLNRFSKDMGAIDEILPRVLIEAMQVMLVMTGILVNVVASNYYMVIAMVILGLVFLKLRAWFIATAKDIKHLEGVTKSPVFSHVNSSLNGITTIRASKAEKVLINEFDQHQDVHTSAWYLTIMCIVSFGLWLDIVCVIFIASVTFTFAILSDYEYTTNGSLVGLAISQSLILTGMLQYGMRQTAEVINQLTSVERVLQYTKLEDEGPFQTPREKITTLPWPSKGLVEFRHMFLVYVRGDPPVLKDLNFTIQPGEKVGIVGRTGAGKSSLISALFRLAPLEGSIYIDGVNTNTLGLTDLRKKISIIPQEPVLFSASLRYNLDPFNEFEDTKLWNALEEVELKDVVDSLDFIVSQGGSNFSLGQRQLICLARAILRNNKILVLDEATANVDLRTDELIQITIRRKFKDCTVLTIAHRLNTIMDSDKVLVMGAGQMLEFDHPHQLLQNPDGHFSRMVLETGPTMTLQLKDVALEAWKQKENDLP